METAAVIKDRLNQRINNIDDLEFLKEVEEIIFPSDTAGDLTEEQKQLTDLRTEAFIKGDAKTFTWQEVKDFAVSPKK